MKKQIMYLMALICCLCGFFISSCQKETFNSESIAENCIKCVVEIKVIDDNPCGSLGMTRTSVSKWGIVK